ncbi:LLM class flavin-dependent oxidoreductase [Streptomyces sp. A7024]|uniref:LLM class flavin-dependent oxidoreductase n=1 Tax=Streptomyces coryli TaxID=1128680 RepID=A0A6G4U760_9ACTN|nr:LLM class flavin-dependent oxidoreductase [Streptomyces coryli]NGN67832.1 LLM class flavin-dependent oxidoreductase [Streptomyces coryli]
MTFAHLGLGISPSAAPGSDPIGDVRAAEDLGFDFVSVSDHPCGTTPTYETWTLLTWMAAATTRIRIASRVLGTPYRPPAMVAKMAETLHRLSGGRLILGLGGGYSDEEFRAFGLGVPTPREKVDGMADAIRIMHGLWTEASFTYSGPRYRVHAADIEPKPDPHRPIPIWLGTYGPRALDVTGRLADGWIPSLGFAAPAQAATMRERILRAAEAAGRDPQAIDCVYNVQVWLDGPAADPGAGTISGPLEAVRERLASFADLGFTQLNLVPAGPDPRAQAERIGKELLPLLR